MGKRGPKRKPAELRIREGGSPRSGTVSHKPIPQVVVVESRDLSDEPPAHLAGSEAGEIWRTVVRSMAEARILDTADTPIVEAFCVQLARMRQARRLLDEDVGAGELENLEQRVRELETLLAEAKGQVAGELRAGRIRSKDLNAIADLELRVGSLQGYLEARRAGGNRVALGANGQLRPHPFLAVERAATAIVERLAGELGLTPAARVDLGLKVIIGRSLVQDLDASIGASARRR